MPNRHVCYVVTSTPVSFAVLATVLTGRVFATDELTTFAHFVAKDSVAQMMADREAKWIPWILVQFPFLANLNASELTDDTAMEWFKAQSHIWGQGTFEVKAVHRKD